MDCRSAESDHDVPAWMEQDFVQAWRPDHVYGQRREKRSENYPPPQGRVSERQGNRDGSRRGLRGVATAEGVSGMRICLLGLMLAVAAATLASSPATFAQTA